MAVVVEVKVVVRGGAGGGDGRCHRRRGRHRRFLKAAAAVFNVVVTTGVRVSKDIQSHRRPVSVKCYEWRTDWLWKSSGNRRRVTRQGLARSERALQKKQMGAIQMRLPKES